MINILQEHVARYPKMQIQDLAKLIYQSEFGGGHLITDAAKSLKRIQEEYQSLNSQNAYHSPVVESIGNGMCRIYLSCLSNGLSANVLNQMFVQSANNHKGTIEGLEQKIEFCLKACKNNELPFSHKEAKAFFENWKLQGYPAMSHSDIYRENYHPAYRVITESFGQIYNVIQRIEKEQPFVVAIDGMSASGKTTLGQSLHENYPESNLFHMDDYFLQPHQRTEERLAEVGGNVDYERFMDEIILHLDDKDGLSCRKFDCQTQLLGSEIHVPWKPLVIIEGSYSQHPYFGEPYDLRIFSEISEEEQKKRILKRNGPEMLERFLDEWIPKENAYFKHYKIKQKSGFLQ